MYRNLDDVQELLKNLMTGEKKKAYYRDYFVKYIRKQEQFLYPSNDKNTDKDKDAKAGNVGTDESIFG